MLDEVIVAGTFGACMGDKFANRAELVIARKYHALFANSANTRSGADLSFFDLQVDKAGEDIHQVVAGEYLLPEIGSAVVTGLAEGIAGAIAVSSGKRQPLR